MKKKNRFVDFFAGKGFYVVLFVCVSCIGLSGYALFFSGAGDAPDDYLNDLNLRDEQGNLDWDIPPAWSDETTQSTPPASPMWDAEESEDTLSVGGSHIAPPPVVPSPADNKAAAGESEASPEPPPSEAPKKANSYVWPVPGQVINPYSKDELVFNPTMGDWRVHMGIDIETAANAKVSAICDGTVEDVYEDALMGTTVVVTHDGDIRSVYTNLSKLPTVAKGDSVRAGDTIGAVGGTALGESSQPNHLHLEIYKGETIQDPLDYLPNR